MKSKGRDPLVPLLVWPEGAGSGWSWGRIGTALVKSAGSLLITMKAEPTPVAPQMET